jgi:hypothetical protein
MQSRRLIPSPGEDKGRALRRPPVAVIIGRAGEFLALYDKASPELMAHLDTSLGKGGWHVLSITPALIPRLER